MKIITLIFVMMLVTVPAHAGRWFFSMTPPHGQTFNVGPYPSHADCNNMLGSAHFRHPFACHIDPSDFNCRIIGNGFAYPKSYPFPVPKDMVIPGGDCFESNEPGVPFGSGFF